jgi:hypothetical protein
MTGWWRHTVSKSELGRLAAAVVPYYLDLGRLARMQDRRNTPFMPAVHA